MLCRHSSDGERPLRAGLAMWRALCVGFLPIVAVTGQLALVQIKGATVQEGNEVTLKCNMERGDMSKYYMYWYRQGPRGKEWISTDGSTYEGFKDRFKARLESSKNSYPLQILAAEPGDAAVYYCRALMGYVPGWLGVAITGPGTILTVLPKVIVEKSTKSQDGGTTVKTTPLPTIFRTKNISSEEQNTTEVICTDKFDSSMVTILPDAGGQRVNMLSMAVLGLRVLLAKSIAFNALMSIKLFLF